MAHKKARRAALRRKLFAQGVAAASRSLDLANVYVCPICTQTFDETSLYDDRLTLEDVPPEAIGGKPIILTCKVCNSTGGHAVDSHAAKRASLRDAIASLVGDRVGSVGSADISLGDVRVRVAISVNAQKHRELKVVREWNNPANVRKFADHMKQRIAEGTTEGLQLQVSLRESFVPRLASVSDLRAAFLACTAGMGYTYAVQSMLDPIRAQIQRPDLELIPRWWFRSKDLKERRSIYVSIEEGIIVVKLDEGCVALPWPSRPPDRYHELLDQLKQNRPITVRGLKFAGWPREFEAHLDHRRSHQDERA